MKLSLLVLLLFFISSTQSVAQTKDYEPGSGFKLSDTYNGLHTVDIGYGKGKMRTMEEMIAANGFYGGFIYLGCGFGDNKSLLTTRASFEVATVLLGARMNFINYTNFDSDQVVFLPELGLSFGGTFSIMYGYNLFLNNNNFDLNRHSFSVSIMPYWKSRL